MLANQLMSQPIITCHVNDALNVPAQRMWDHDCGAVAVVNDEGTLVGMVTDRDICMAAYTQGLSLEAMLVNCAMSRHVVATHANQPIEDVERLMAEHKIRRVPVIDSVGRPIGIVSLHDVARECAQPGAKQAQQQVATTLAAICTPRAPARS